MSLTIKNVALAALLAGTTLVAGAQTSKESVGKGWHLQDLEKDGVHGISLDKAYQFLKGKKSTPVIVAVIDSGIDTLHEDLKPVLWRNPKEKPGNGKDDDGNGYVDDVYGWNFLGGKDGRNVKEDSYEAARVYHKFKSEFEKVTNPGTLKAEDRSRYDMWKRAQAQVAGGDPNSGLELMVYKRVMTSATAFDSVLQKGMGKATYTGNDLEAYQPQTPEQKSARTGLLYFFKSSNIMEMTNAAFLSEIDEVIKSEEKKAEAADKAPKPYRAEIVQDNYNDINDRFYGNPDVMANTPFHGTHVSGIIAAARNNGKGIDGIAENVQIMSLRAVPDGDEHDKDVALAIRYAVDNGAKVINMSFGKSFSPEKSWVDEAVEYAASKGVLLVHAAGNDGKNLDSAYNFPNPIFEKDGKRATNWITVGASGDPKAGGLVASFSNWGKSEVDVFAPGVRIYSTVPGGTTYGNAQGTSMASPVVAGVAALIKSYYPNLTPQQLKYVIEASATKSTVMATNPETGKPAPLSELSVTGGLLNAYEAVRLADQVSSGKVNAAPAADKGKEKRAF
ncbi:S8 family peptidase [Paracnuella aquatica]|uniref:S8 family peptidase n=1 Tax=Paracnuella aquatica TaxID=2268757 RepID=UPI000DEFDFCB|nr:S8 family peptidase [Paracnuella aquatica]RPD51193.1 peptidase S8 [Paracnuella aquatica]